MFDLPEQFWDLSPKRQEALAKMRQKERQDSALNAVVVGLKCMNHVHGYGMTRLGKLSKIWGKAITDFYSAGFEHHAEWQNYGFCGDLVTDPITAFSDLSGRRLREITSFLAENRQEAHGNAIAIGMETIRRECGFGDLRVDRLLSQWFADVREFYADRETTEPLLKKWIEEIGFVLKDGRLRSYMTEDGQCIRKATAERWLKEDAEEKV